MKIWFPVQNFKQTASLLLIFTFILSGFAQENIKQKVTNKKGNPTFISFNEKSTYTSGESQKAFKEQLGLKDNASFSKVKSEKDNLGFEHEKFQLHHQGVKVEFATYTLHSKSGKLESMTGEFYQTDKVNTSPKLTSNQAFEAAVHHVGAQQYLWENQQESLFLNYKKPQGELVLLPIQDNSDGSQNKENIRLAYKFDIYATSPLSRGDIYIDAVTGSVLLNNPTIKHLGEFSHGKSKTNFEKQENLGATLNTMITANAATRYSGTQSIQTTSNTGSYLLKDATRGNGINTYNLKTGTSYASAVNFTDADNNWTAAEYNNTLKDNAALDAHWGAEKTYDYWWAVHGRNGYDAAGASVNSYVHYDNSYNNAFWNGSAMTYGDGNGTTFDPLTSLDIAAHEIGHAICEKTANLVYEKESGAMNEAFSDIWGACVEYYAAPTKSTWLIGEDMEKRSGHLSLRSMSNPKNEGQPDTYKGMNWKPSDCTPDPYINDYCGVHTNSGILNHWFYILSIGKTGTNDNGATYNVTGITIDKAAKIAYRLESTYLTPNATYADARTFGIKATVDLYGLGSAEEIATTNAFYAVGLGLPYGVADTVAPTVPANLAASSTSTTTIKLSWTASTDYIGINGYDVYKNNTLLTTTTTPSYDVTRLTPSTPYSFYVKAKDVAGNISASSNVVNINTPPITLYATVATKTSTILSWTIPAGSATISGYAIYKDENLLTEVAGTNYTVNDLASTTTYSFTVKAKYATGTLSEASNKEIVTMPDSTPPSAVTDLTATTKKGTTINLKWTCATDNVGVFYYQIFANEENKGSGITCGNGWQSILEALTPATTYSLYLKTVDTAGNLSEASNVITVKTDDTVPPNPPLNLSASNTTLSTTSLSWTAATDNIAVIGYKIYKDSALIATTTTTSTNYNVTGLASGKSTSFAVRAIDEYGNISNSSNVINVSTLADSTPPSVPTNLTASVATNTSINLSWAAATDNVAVAGYSIYKAGTLLATVTGTTYSVIGLTPNTPVSFTVKATDVSGNISAASAVVNTSTTADITAPTAPTNLSGSATTASTTTLSWTASTDNIGIKEYEIYKNGNLLITVTGTTYTATGLVAGTNYPFTVKAKDAAGNKSVASSILNINTADTIAPTVPTSLAYSGTTATTTNLSWISSADGTGVTGYNIYKNGVLLTSVTGTTYTAVGLTPNSATSFYVKAKDAVGNMSAASTTINVTTLTDTTAPSVPTNLTASGTTTTTTNLSWTASTDNVGVKEYAIYNNNNLIATTTATTLNAINLIPGTANSFTVKAKDNAGNNSTASTILVISTSPDITPPSTPLNLIISDISQNKATLNWNPSSDNLAITGYKIYKDGDLFDTVTGTTYTANGLTDFPNHLFYVRAIDKAGNASDASNVVSSADTTPPTSPTNLASSGTTATTTNLSWTASTDNIGVKAYEIYKNNALLTSVSGTTYTVQGLTPNTIYVFTVKAKDAAGNASAASTTSNVTILPDTTAPTAPTYLISAGTTTTTTTNLSWTASTDDVAVTAYEVYKAGVLLTTVTGTTYTVTGLTPNTRYTFTIKAKDGAGNVSAASTASNVTTLKDTTAPSAPTNLASTGTTLTTTNLSWTASTDNIAVTAYEVYKAGVLLTTVTGTTYTVTGLTPNTTYTFTVKAKDAATNVSAASTASNVTTLKDTTAPTAPTNLAVTGTTATTTNLSWTASTDNIAVTAYEVYKAGILVATATETTYAVTGLTPNTAYAFTVKAKDAATNKSVASVALNVTTLPDTTAPTTPTNLAATGTTATTTNLSWTASTDNVAVAGYEIYKNNVLLTSVTGTTYAVTGLTPYITYAFTVKAKDAAGNLSVATTINATTLLDTTAPTAPTNLAVTGTTATTTNLSWTASTDNVAVTGYEVYKAGILVATATGTTYAVTGLTPNTAYAFTVKAKDVATNKSVASVALNVTTLPDTTTPTAPTNLAVTGTTATTTNLSWTASTDNVAVAGYEIYKAGILVATVAGTTYAVTGLTPNTSYVFTVKAKDAAGNLSVATTINATTLLDTTAPTAPTNLTATGTTATTTNLSWNASTDNVSVAGYEIYKNNVLLTSVTGTTYAVTGLTPNTTYAFTVKAKDAAGNLSVATTINATTLLDTTAPSDPTNLAAVGTTDATTNLSWTASTDNVAVTGYEIYKAGALLATVTGTTYPVPGLTPNTAYVFSVKAKDAATNKSAATVLNVITLPDATRPTSPTNLTATGTTATTTNLSWTASTDNAAVAGYEVYNNNILLAPASGTTYPVPGLTPNTTYAFTVKAKDATGNISAASTAVNVMTLPDTTAPTAPTNLTATGTTATTTNLSWTASTDNVAVAGYEVYKEGVYVITVTGTTSPAIGLTPNTTYTFTVKAQDAAGNISVASTTINVTTLPDAAAPTAPTNLTATGTTATTTTLSWTASTDNIAVKEYEVYKAGVLVTTVVTGTTYNVPGLTPNTTYAFTVKAKDAAGNISAASTTMNVTTLPDTSAPTSPTNLTATKTMDTTINLSWTASTDNIDVTEYEIYKNNVLLATVIETTYPVIGLTRNTAYTFIVKAKDAAGNKSLASSTIIVTTLNDTTAPSAPTNLTATGTTASTTNLSWTASTDNIGVTSYDIYRNNHQYVWVSGTTFSVDRLTPNTTYTFTIKAKDADGNSSMASNTVNITTLNDLAPPAAPTNLTATETTDTTTKLSWTNSTDNVAIKEYEVYKGGVLVAIVEATIVDAFYTVQGLTPNTTYAFTVKAKDAAGNRSLVSNAANITTLSGSYTIYVKRTGSTENPRIHAWSKETGVDVAITNSANWPANLPFMTAQGNWYAYTTTKQSLGLLFKYSDIQTIDFKYYSSSKWLLLDAGGNLISTTDTNPEASGLSFSKDKQPSANGKYLPGTTVSFGLNRTATCTGCTYNDQYTLDGSDPKTSATKINYAAATTFPVTQYTRVRAISTLINPASGTAYTNEINEVLDFDVVMPPTNLTASGTTATTTNLSWTASTGNIAATAYNIYNGTTLINTVTGTTFVVPNLTPSTPYTFTVKAKDAAGNLSVSSNAANITTTALPDTTAPTAPTNLAATGTTSTTTNLSWTASTDNIAVTGYEVYKSGVLVTSVIGTSYAVPGLTANTTYTFNVKAKDAAGNISATSNIINVITLPDTSAPTSPTNLVATGTTSITTNLSWMASTDNIGVTEYDIYKNNVLLASVNGTTYAVPGLTPSTAYTFTIKAKDAAGNSSAVSNSVIVTTASAAITIYVKKGVAVIGQEPKIHVWTKQTGTDVAITNTTNWPANLPKMTLVGTDNWYKFTLPNDSKSLGCLFIFGTLQTADFININADTWIEFNADGSLKSNTNTARSPLSTTIFEPTAPEVNPISNNNESLILYPNPTTDLLNINYSVAGSEQIEVAIFDIIGNLVYMKKEYNKDGFNQELSLLNHNLKSGAYFLSISSSKGTIIKKFLVTE